MQNMLHLWYFTDNSYTVYYLYYHCWFTILGTVGIVTCRIRLNVLVHTHTHTVFGFSSLQVLLKRYLSSQAFVNVAAALAQYFRRMVSGRPVQLDIQSLTEHIGGWMLEEVLSIAAMHEAALHQLFCHMWKFSKRWCSVLNPPLPRDLELLKVGKTD